MSEDNIRHRILALDYISSGNKAIMQRKPDLAKFRGKRFGLVSIDSIKTLFLKNMNQSVEDFWVSRAKKVIGLYLDAWGQSRTTDGFLIIRGRESDTLGAFERLAESDNISDVTRDGMRNYLRSIPSYLVDRDRASVHHAYLMCHFSFILDNLSLREDLDSLIEVIKEKKGSELTRTIRLIARDMVESGEITLHDALYILDRTDTDKALYREYMPGTVKSRFLMEDLGV